MNERDQDRLVELEEILTNHTPDADTIARIEVLRDRAAEFGACIIASAPDCRSRALALTHLEDCVMRAVQAMVLPSANARVR